MKTINELDFGVPEEIEKYTSHSTEIAFMILNYIQSTPGMNKKKFAKLVGKSSTDVSRWLSGSHNFTILTLSLIEAKTGIEFIKQLSDSQIKQHLKGECFKQDNESELKTQLSILKRELNDLKKEHRLLKIQSSFEPNNEFIQFGFVEPVYEMRFKGQSVVLLNDNFNKIRLHGKEVSKLKSYSDRLTLKAEDIIYNK